DLSSLMDGGGANSNDEKIVSLQLVSNQLVITEGAPPMVSMVDLSSLQDGGENPTNELITDIALLSGDTLVINEGGTIHSVDLSSLAGGGGGQNGPTEILSDNLQVCGFGTLYFVVPFFPSFSGTPGVSLNAMNPSPITDPEPVTDVTGVTSTEFTGTVELAHGTITVDSFPTPNTLGRYNSLLDVQGRPALCYTQKDSASNRLYFARALDAEGTAWAPPVEVLREANLFGYFYVCAGIVNGHPAISYYNADLTSLHYVRATDPLGTTWGPPVTVDTNRVGVYCSLVEVNGRPALAYHDWLNIDLKYVRADDVNGDSWGTPQVVASAGRVGAFACMAVIAGNPAISYYDATPGD
ncbi:MAG: hypothetical protein AAF492_31990, partial [Verrucomicrobiota bacterium]